MVDFDYYLGLKYGNQKTTADANANLANVQAQNYAADQQARAKAAQTSADATMLDARSQAPLRAAQAASTTALIQPSVNHLSAETGLLGEQTMTSHLNRDLINMQAPDSIVAQILGRAGINVQTRATAPPQLDANGQPIPNNRTSGSVDGRISVRPMTLQEQADYDDAQAAKKKAGLKKGSANVKGPGDGTVDTIPTMLANGEAVLNKGGAETLGRKTIRHLNTIGMAKMGMIDKKGARKAAGGKKPGHYAEGTSEVTPQPLISSGGGTGAGAMAGGTGTPVMMMGMPVQNGPTVADLLGVPSPTPATATPRSYAGGHSQVGKGNKSDTPKPTAQNLRTAIKGLGNLGMAKKPLPKGFGKPGMV